MENGFPDKRLFLFRLFAAVKGCDPWWVGRVSNNDVLCILFNTTASVSITSQAGPTGVPSQHERAHTGHFRIKHAGSAVIRRTTVAPVFRARAGADRDGGCDLPRPALAASAS